ncbi:uncharacterized protein JCM6883_007510 [Sporobolomyces salmoneus]|uniref:uncharacterized protein n=1 Tax=Sporobolomyces salmoneus TaxID=183962 RepID=UPI00316ED260
MSATTPYTAPPIDFSQLSSPGVAPSTTSTSSLTESSSFDTTSTPPSELPASHNTTAPGDQLVNAPSPASAHLDRAGKSTVDPAAAELSPADKAPAPGTERLSESDGSAQAVSGSRETPASRSIPQGDQAPAPATESAPVASQKVQLDSPAVKEPVAVPLDTTVARPPTSSTVPLETSTSQQQGVPVRQADTAPPATSKPILPSAQGHIAEHPSTETDADHVLPLGHDIHPVHQAAALSEAPDHLVNAQVEKHKADKREVMGEEPKGTIVPGMEDDKLWAMIRRFDVQIAHVLTPPTKLPKGEPDLRPSTLPAVPFDSDELKSNLERVYATLGVWLIFTARELMRLMSWDDLEKKRTACFCAAYFISATFGLVIPALMVLFATLTVYPKSRKFLFPPIPPPPGQPPSATDPTNQRGDESMLAVVNHPIEHRSRAEQIEQQAWEFTNVVQRFGVRVVVGGKMSGKQGNAEVGKKQHVDSDSDSESELDAEEVELNDVANQEGLAVAADKEKDEGKMSDKQRAKAKAKEAKAKRDAMVGNMAKQTQDALGNLADLMEVFANALTPPKPYPQHHARERLAASIFLPVAVVFAVIPIQWWARLASFAFGFMFFGQPLIIRGVKLFVEKVPDWQEKLDLRNSIFSGVPTNAQLVLHIVRVAERAYTPFPLPPPPPTASHMKAAVAANGLEGDDSDSEAEGSHSVEAGSLAGKPHEDEEDDSLSTKDKVVHSGKKKFVSAFRKVAKKAATFRADVQVEGDTARQKVGNKIDRMFYQSRAKDDHTPHSFPAKWNGTSGHIIIAHSPSSPSSLISFTPLKASIQHPVFEKPIEDIVEIKKRGVWIGRTVLGWAASVNLEGMGLNLRFKSLNERMEEKVKGGLGEGDKPHEELHQGETIEFTHVARRDELVRRLMGISDARWETL